MEPKRLADECNSPQRDEQNSSLQVDGLAKAKYAVGLQRAIHNPEMVGALFGESAWCVHSDIIPSNVRRNRA